MSFLSRKILLIVLLTIVGWLISPLSHAQQGKGLVNMQGAIVDTACSIDTGDREQSINMGSLPLAEISAKGKGIPHAFSIRLTDCVLERSNPRLADWKKFQITFDGSANGALFSLLGKASGVDLRISDADGHIALAGQALPAQMLIAGDMRMDYFLTLVRNHQPLVAGNYFTTIRFKLDYF